MTLEKLTTYLLAERRFTPFDTKKLVNWAVEVLNIGFSSENLYILAGLDYDSSDIREQYFLKSLEDIQIEFTLSDDELLHVYSLLIAEKAVKHTMNIQIAFEKILNVVGLSNYDDRYIEFYKISEDLSYIQYENKPIFNSSLNLSNYEDFILKEFKNLLIRQTK